MNIDNLTITLAIIAFALLGGWLSRMCGGAPPKLPWGMDQWLYASPYGLISLPASSAILLLLFTINVKPRAYWKFVALIALLPYFGAFLGKRTGHGGGIDAGTSKKNREDESLEFLIKPLHGNIDEYWYDMLLLAITGIATTLLAGTIICFLDIAAGTLILVSGGFKAVAYMIGWTIYPSGKGKGIPHLNEATAIGEFLTGIFAYAALAIAFVLVFDDFKNLF